MNEIHNNFEKMHQEPLNSQQDMQEMLGLMIKQQELIVNELKKSNQSDQGNSGVAEGKEKVKTQAE